LSFGYLCALLYKGPIWHKLVLLVSTIPITIAVNSVRIGITGALVEYGGSEMAEGFLHAFEGWIIFLAALMLLFALMWGLARSSGRSGGIGDLMRLDLLTLQAGADAAVPEWRPSPQFVCAAGFAVVAAVVALLLPARAEVAPERKSFALFPTAIEDWQGWPLTLDRMYIDALKFDDYVLADYRRAGDANPVNLYVAFYASQRKGASVHSPRSCIPGGGWEISSLGPARIDRIGQEGRSLKVNRAVIAKGTDKQLVYYWFDQRGRQMTSEYHVKLMLFWDALTRNRTDGALVRLVTPVPPGEDLAAAERRLNDFLGAAYPPLQPYLPS
jgi:exosortase D (VPLPA-CTERM-specific)